jgi:hypothetical protein
VSIASSPTHCGARAAGIGICRAALRASASARAACLRSALAVAAVALAATAAAGAAAARASARLTRMRWISFPAKRSTMAQRSTNADSRCAAWCRADRAALRLLRAFGCAALLEAASFLRRCFSCCRCRCADGAAPDGCGCGCGCGCGRGAPVVEGVSDP